MAWKEIGPSTWQQGRFRLYRATMPADVYWLSIDGRDPIRCETKEIAQAVIKKVNEKPHQTSGQNK